MRRLLRSWPFFFVALSGCSIHPHVDDLAQDALPDIVMKIRCETKAAILQAFPDDSDYLRSTSVAFKFEFTMKENDELSSNGSVKIPIAHGSFTMGWDAGLQKERRSTQTIGIGDNFKRLTELPCHKEMARPNFLYPITGEIGVLKSVQNYSRLVDENRGLFVGEISDVLRFQTDWNGTLKPTWNLTPLSKQVIAVNGNAVDKRSDIHQVTISFTAPAKPLTLAERQAKDAADKEAALKTRKLELQRMAEEKAIPTHFVIVDPDNRPIDPRTLVGQRPASEPSTPGAGRSAPGEAPAPARAPTAEENEKRLEAARKAAIDKAARTGATVTPSRPASRPSQEENDRRAYEELQRNEALRTNQRILDELRSRGVQ